MPAGQAEVSLDTPRRASSRACLRAGQRLPLTFAISQEQQPGGRAGPPRQASIFLNP